MEWNFCYFTRLRKLLGFLCFLNVIFIILIIHRNEFIGFWYLARLQSSGSGGKLSWDVVFSSLPSAFNQENQFCSTMMSEAITYPLHPSLDWITYRCVSQGKFYSNISKYSKLFFWKLKFILLPNITEIMGYKLSLHIPSRGEDCQSHQLLVY